MGAIQKPERCMPGLCAAPLVQHCWAVDPVEGEPAVVVFGDVVRVGLGWSVGWCPAEPLVVEGLAGGDDGVSVFPVVGAVADEDQITDLAHQKPVALNSGFA